jgi:hypothetical protein
MGRPAHRTSSLPKSGKALFPLKLHRSTLIDPARIQIGRHLFCLPLGALSERVTVKPQVRISTLPWDIAGIPAITENNARAETPRCGVNAREDRTVHSAESSNLR